MKRSCGSTLFKSLFMRFGPQPIFCQPSENGKAMHKSSQAPQRILLNDSLEFTAAYRLLNLHVLWASLTQHIPNQISDPATLSLCTAFLLG